MITIALEPERRNFEVLEINMALNTPTNLFIRKQAIGSYTHQARMIVGSLDLAGHHRVVEDAVGRDDLKGIVERRETQDIDVISVDDLSKEYAITAIKADIDGSENEFLEGAKNLLSGNQVKNLMIELYKPDSTYYKIMQRLSEWSFHAHQEYFIESGLYNVWFKKII